MDALHFLLLKLISEHDGEWSWYQIDRKIATYHHELVDQLSRMMSVLAELEADGLITSDPSVNRTQPRYWITNGGRARLEEAAD